MKHNTLYHYTKAKYLPSIQKLGLIPGFKDSPYVPKIPDSVNVWLDAKLYKLKTPGWAVIQIDVAQLDPNKLERPRYGKRWYVYVGVIPPEAISYVDSLPG